MALREEVLQELGRIAFGEASDESKAAVKMASKLRALELLGKHLGLFDRDGPREPGDVTIVDDLRDGDEP